MVVFPAPVWPTNATVSPAAIVNDTSFNTHSVGGISLNDFICAAKVDALNR